MRILLLFAITLAWVNVQAQNHPDSGYKLDPPRYMCQKISHTITIDGEINPSEWNKASWSDQFIDIRGKEHPKQPIYSTRMKMLWDDENIYIAAELEEPHLWATLTKRDSRIYFDNDFEVFIDPNGDTHNYYEFEINAYGTEWDLMLTKPYRFGGTFIDGYTMIGLETAVKLYGTINNPSDTDSKWCVEMKIPIKAIINGELKVGQQWRFNFSRVQWLQITKTDNQYKKLKGKEGFGSEENWVWAPTGIVDIHRPEFWGFVQFADSEDAVFEWNKNEDIKFELRRLLNMQLAHYKKEGKYAKKFKGYTSSYKPKYAIIGGTIVISIEDWYITNDSRVYYQKSK